MSQFQLLALTHSRNDSQQVVHTHACASATKQHNSVLAKGWRHSVAGKVTTGLADYHHVYAKSP